MPAGYHGSSTPGNGVIASENVGIGAEVLTFRIGAWLSFSLRSGGSSAPCCCSFFLTVWTRSYPLVELLIAAAALRVLLLISAANFF